MRRAVAPVCVGDKVIGTVCILLTVLTAMARTKELTPSDEEIREIRSAPKGLHHAVAEIADAVRTMPVATSPACWQRRIWR